MAVNPSPRRVRVLVPLALPEPYDYALPDGMEAEPGAFVVVPLGGTGTGAVARGLPADG